MSATRTTLAGIGLSLAAILVTQILAEWLRLTLRPQAAIAVVSAVAVAYVVARRNAGWGGAIRAAVAGTALMVIVGFVLAAAYVLTGAAAAEHVGPALLLVIARSILAWSMGGIILGVAAGRLLARPPTRAHPLPAGDGA